MSSARSSRNTGLMDEEKPLRADARRNRDRVMEVARTLFEEKGPTVEMDEVARAAGVGVGTIYRHFPTKEALIQGVLAEHIQRLVDAMRARADETDPGRAFFECLAFLADEFLARGSLHQAMARAGFAPPAPEHRDAFRSALETLLSRAQAAGAVRGDVAASEVILLVRGALLPSEERPITVSARRRMFDVVCSGLRQTPPRRRSPADKRT